MTTTTRRDILAGAAAVPALAMPAIALPAGIDPIFAAIDRHKTANAEFERVVRREEQLTETIPAERRRRHYVGDRDNAEMIASDDPAWTEYMDAWFAASDAANDRALDLLNIAPISIAGVAALLNYAAAFEKNGGELFPDTIEEGGANPLAGGTACMAWCADCLRALEVA
jgi:hypothetical protein